MDYYALEWENLWFFYMISEKSPFGKELQAFRLGSMPAFQAKSGAGRPEKKRSRPMLHNSGLGVVS